jgi:hypothetical protein
MKKIPIVITNDYTNFKNSSFSGISTAVVGESDYQKFKYKNTEKGSKLVSSSKLNTVGAAQDNEDETLGISFDTAERISDEQIRKKVEDRIKAIEAEAARRKKIEKQMITEAEIRQASGKNVRLGKGKRPYYFVVGDVNLAPIKKFSKTQIMDEKYKDAKVLNKEIADIANTLNQALEEGIVELEKSKSKKDKTQTIKILDKDKFKKLIKDRNKADNPKKKKATKKSPENAEKEISKNSKK